ncbi:unnamed protein product [Coregonus sp. 'balchen']|nr:unnamed protein product [Coregonus sp. 'balchen']
MKTMSVLLVSLGRMFRMIAMKSERHHSPSVLLYVDSQSRVDEEQIDRLGTEAEGGKVAFSASLLVSGHRNTGPHDYETKLIYRNAFTNIGNHYNSGTAPVRGVYYFRFIGHFVTERMMALRLFKNDQPIVIKDVEDSASNGVVLHLGVGYVVSMRLMLGTHIWDDQYQRTTFSSFQLEKIVVQRRKLHSVTL